jgi:hypothetical protein
MTQEWKEPAAGEDVQMPLGTGGDGAAPAEEYSAPKVRVNTSTLALIASFMAALAVLYFMGMQNKPRAASAGDRTRIDEMNRRVDDFLGNKDSRDNVRKTSDRLLVKLQSQMGGAVAPPAEPSGNPWEVPVVEKPVAIIDLPPLVAVATPAGLPVEPPPPERVDPLLKEVAKEYPSLKLQLVLKGNPSSAMINNQMASVGSRFGHLVVTDIENDRVLLTYEGPTGKLVLPLYLNGTKPDPNSVFGGTNPK